MIAIGTTDAERARKNLTKYQRDFQDPTHKITLKFFDEDGDGNLFVPRIYAQTELKYPRPTTPDPPKLPPGLSIKGALMETPNRPQISVFDKTVALLHKQGGASVVLPCGAGKTNTAIAIALAMGVRTLILCHKNFLLEQWRERLMSFVAGNFQIGQIQQNICTSGDFVLGSIQSVMSSTRNYPSAMMDFGLVIVDECHHIAAPTFSRVLQSVRFRYSLGLTATPKRKDGLEKIIYYLVGFPSYTLITPPRPDVQVNIVQYHTGSHEEIVYNNGTLGMSRMVTRLTEDPARNFSHCASHFALCKPCTHNAP